MELFDRLYTVEDIANMASLTPRTIRNYLKNGILKGKKIGGQWQFTMEDIKNLFDNSNFARDTSDNIKQQILDFVDGVNTDIKGSIQVCTIADYYCETQEQAKAICSKLISIYNENQDKYPVAKFDYQYIESESKARFTLFGAPDYIIKILEMLK